MKHPLLISIATMGSLVWGGIELSAQESMAKIDFSLNLLFADQMDAESGGTWQLVGRAVENDGVTPTGIGAFAVQLMDILNPEFELPRGQVDGVTVGFEIEEVINFDNYTELVGAQVPQEQDIEQPLFYDVGVIGGGTAPGDTGPDFSFDPGTTRSIPWGIADPLGNAAWDGAALLASGDFDPGTTPSFFSSQDTSARGLVFTTVGDEFTPGSLEEAMVSTIVRDNLMELMGLVGDYDNSGQVEQADLDLVLLNWGDDGTTPPTGWVNDLPSGEIDQSELDRVLLNWGAMSPAALGGAQAVPEPSSILLLTIAAVALAVRCGGWRESV